MAQEIQTARVITADGSERTLMLLSVSGETAYLCAAARYAEAVNRPELGVGFPMKDVTLLGRISAKSAIAALKSGH